MSEAVSIGGPLRCYTNGSEWWAARDIPHLRSLYRALCGLELEDADAQGDDSAWAVAHGNSTGWCPVGDDELLSSWEGEGPGVGELYKKTARAWCDELGEGFLFTTEG